MTAPAKMVPVFLAVPVTTSREVKGYLTEDVDGELLLVIGDRARRPGDSFDGRPLCYLHLYAANDDDMELADRFANAARESEYERRERERVGNEGRPFPQQEN